MLSLFKPAGRLAKASVAALGIFALTACEPGGVGGGQTIDTSVPVPVALLVPQGSDRSGDALLAQSIENAARLAIADLGDVRIDLRVYPTAGEATTAQAAAIQAVDEGAKIILGPVFAEAANAAGLAVANRNVNVLSFSNNAGIAGGNVFVLGPTFNNTANRLVDFAGRSGRSNVLIVHANNVSGIAGRDAIRAALARSSVSEAGSVGYEFSQQGVIAAVANIRDIAEETSADAIFLTSDTSGALPLLTQMLPEAGLKPDVVQYIGLTRWDIPAQTLELPGVQNGWFALPDPTLNEQFQSRYASTYGGLPHPIGGLAYDGIAAIGALVKAGKSDALTAGALTQSAGFQGVSGVFRLLSDGTNERGLAVATIRERQVVVIEPAPTRFGRAGF